MSKLKKEKIINDPIYGFIKIETGIILDIIEHPFFQRLRRISQLGLSYLVYPGAYHTRFHHALGCLFLMNKAIEQLRKKGHTITNKEEEAVCLAILLHDIGHSPFSHALEKSIVNNINHEDISLLFMQKLDEQFNGKLSLAIKIFQNKYKKKFLHQLISSQLDMDRLDYLTRDSFYSGVQEGVIGTERIINMLNVVENKLVIEEKGIYSIEKFLIARRLMYWQVYLHKTVLSAENTLMKVMKRAKEVASIDKRLFASDALIFFIKNKFTRRDLKKNHQIVQQFAQLDDHDIFASLKQWTKHKDFVLSSLSRMIIERKLLKVKIKNQPFTQKEIIQYKKIVIKKYDIKEKDAGFFVFSDKISNSTYNYEKTKINILMKDYSVKDIKDVSDQSLNGIISKKVKKYFLCFPRIIPL